MDSSEANGVMIRQATVEDLPEIARVHIASWRDAYTESLPADYLAAQVTEDLNQHWQQQDIRSDDIVLVAEDRDIVTGFIAIWCRPFPFIDNLHVLPQGRSKGAGARLMTEAFKSLVALGQNSAHLWVFETNLKAIRFYQRLGAVVSDRQVKYFFGNEVVNLRMDWSELATTFDN